LIFAGFAPPCCVSVGQAHMHTTSINGHALVKASFTTLGTWPLLQYAFIPSSRGGGGTPWPYVYEKKGQK